VLVSNSPEERLSDRKLRLVLCGTFRTLELDTEAISEVESVELFADDKAFRPEFLEYSRQNWGQMRARFHQYRYDVLRLATQDVVPPHEVDWRVHQLVVAKSSEWITECCSLVRDIFGNPFRPVAFSPEWRTTTAVAIAQGMYESRDFGPMPLLADALQDAGCEQPDILDHCRGPGPHVRGCWVVDGVLGKS
jgi:hypothetical protein